MQKRQASIRQRPLFEELEPRILYSADAGVLLHPDALTPSAEVRILELSSPSQDTVEQTATTRAIIFVDTHVSNYQQLVDDLLTNQNASQKIDVVLLDNTRDGIEQISAVLKNYNNIDAVHIVSHGSAGTVDLGSGQLNFDSLLQNASAIKEWGNALNSGADILIYSCDLASSKEGQSLIGALSHLTGGDVAASDDKTGAAALGGDWVLEYHTGVIQAKIAISEYGQQHWNGVLANTAPSLDASKNPALTTQNEDSGAPVGAVGTLVSTLVDFASPTGQVDNVTDPDVGALLGIAITATNTTDGTWHYSTNNGTNWNAIGAVNNSSALLLAADANTRIYFEPDANYNGTLTNAITFHAWDQSSGSNGATVNLQSATVRDNFTASAYNNNNGTATWSSNWIDIDENPNGGNYRITGGQLQIRDNNTTDWLYREANLLGATSATLTFDYTSDLNAGVGGLINLQASNNGGTSYTTIATFSNTLNTGTGSFSADISAYTAANTRVRFLTAGNSTPTKTLLVDNFQISYEILLTGGATAFSTTSDTASLMVNPVNNAPVNPILPLPLDLFFDAPTSGSAAGFTDSGLNTSPTTKPLPSANERSPNKSTDTANLSGPTSSANNEGVFIETVETLNRDISPDTNSFSTIANVDITTITNTSRLTSFFDYIPVTFQILEPIELQANGIAGLSNSYNALFNGITPGTGIQIENIEFHEPVASSNQEISQLILEHKVALSSAAMSVGLVSWASQFSALFSSVLATIPAWRNLDPVAILGEDDEDEPEWDMSGEDIEENAEETAVDIMSEETGAHSSRDIV